MRPGGEQPHPPMPAAQPHSSKKTTTTHPPVVVVRSARIPARAPLQPPKAVVAPKAPPAAAAAGAAPGAPTPKVFSEAVFGARLARALDALLAMQRADAAQIARGPRGPLGAVSNKRDSEMLNLVSKCAQYWQKASIHELSINKL